MFFTLAVSAATPERLRGADRPRAGRGPVRDADSRPAEVAWRSPDGRAALLHWGDAGGRGRAPGERRAAR